MCVSKYDSDQLHKNQPNEVRRREERRVERLHFALFALRNAVYRFRFTCLC